MDQHTKTIECCTHQFLGCSFSGPYEDAVGICGQPYVFHRKHDLFDQVYFMERAKAAGVKEQKEEEEETGSGRASPPQWSYGGSPSSRDGLESPISFETDDVPGSPIYFRKHPYGSIYGHFGWGDGWFANLGLTFSMVTSRCCISDIYRDFPQKNTVAVVRLPCT